MGSITTGIGLMSGIDTGSLIDSLITLESRGKVALQQRIARLQSQQSAILDINARLLAFKSIASSFRTGSIFSSALATSSNEDILTATARTIAQPGSYSFTIRQLASNAQALSRGFATADSTPIGLTSLSFDFGRGQLHRDRDLEELNGGQGISQGKILVTDRAGNQATIDLTDATTINEVLQRINESGDVAVQARVSGDAFVIEDTSGGAGTLTVANAIGFTTASDLGIAGSSADGLITGSSINFLDGATALSMLNDGTGLLIRNNVTDLRITDRNGIVHNIDLGRINANIATDTLLAELNNGNGVPLSDDNDNPDIKFIARDGTEFEVNLTGVTTVGGLINRVNTQTGGHIQLSITDGKRLTVTDTVGGAGSLRIEGAGTGGASTAEALGILNADGVTEDSFTGEIIPNTLTNAPVHTIEQLIDRIAEQTGSAITASVSGDGTRLLINDNTGGAGNLIIQNTAGNPYLADQLGITTDAPGVADSQVTGHRLLSDLGSVLMRHINGGNGLNGADSIELTDRNGNSVTINGLSAYESLSELIASINDQAASSNVSVSLSLNDAGTGLVAKDTSGGTASNLVIAGDAAAALGIEADVNANTVRGSHLKHQYITEATRLIDLNFGRGIAIGSFRIIDGIGKSATVNVTSEHTTIYDVIQNINSRGIGVKARINDTGDGLLIEEDPGGLNGQSPFAKIRVESVSGSTARDLNILGTSETVSDATINGGYRTSLEFEENATLNQIVSAINSAGIPMTASIINSGSGPNPFRINFSSEISGRRGEMVIDTGGFDLGLTTLTRAQDAKVFFGTPGQEGGFLITSSTNSVRDVVPGVTLDLKKASDQAVTINVERDVSGVVEKVGQFVKAFNDAIARIDEHDFFNVDDERRGILLGNPTTARIRQTLFRTLRQRAEGVDGQFQFLHQVGIRIGQGGKVEFDEERFRNVFEQDPDAVRALFNAHEQTTSPPEEILPGITVGGGGGQITTARGLGVIFDDMLDALTDSVDGTVKLAEQTFDRQIRLSRQRLEAFETRLDARRQRLERQFVAMESALAQLHGQGNALVSLNNLLTSQLANQRRGGL